MPLELCGDIGAFGIDPEAKLARVGDQRLDQLQRHPAPADLRRDQRMVSHPHPGARDPGQPPDRFRAFDMGVVFTALIIAMKGYADLVQRGLLA